MLLNLGLLIINAQHNFHLELPLMNRKAPYKFTKHVILTQKCKRKTGAKILKKVEGTF